MATKKKSTHKARSRKATVAVRPSTNASSRAGAKAKKREPPERKQDD